MDQQQEKEILNSVIRKYGMFHQFDMLTEEVGELLQAINKVKRKLKINDIKFSVPDNCDSIEYCLAYWGLCSEVADVKILIRQMELMLNKEAIDLSYERKLLRLKEIIKQ